MWEWNPVTYTVKYLEQITNKVLADPDTFAGEYGSTVTAQARDLSDQHYKLMGDPSQELTLNADNMEVIFYYAQFSDEDAVTLMIQLEYIYILDGTSTTADKNEEITDYVIDGSITIRGTQYSSYDGKTYDLTGAKVNDKAVTLVGGNFIFMADTDTDTEYTVTLIYELTENSLTVKYEDGKQIQDPVTNHAVEGALSMVKVTLAPFCSALASTP